MRIPFKQPKSEKGQSLLELAVGMVVLLILLAGIIDLGRLLFFYIGLRDAAQEGAVVGSLNARDCQDIRIRVRTVAGSGSGDLSIGVKVEYSTEAAPTTYIETCINDSPPATSVACAPNNLRITASSNFTFVAPFFAGRTIPLSTEITQTILRPPCP